MKEEQNIQQEAKGSSFKMLRAMVGIGVVCGLLIVFTFEISKPRIDRLKKEALEKAIVKVLPNISKNKPFQINKDGTFSPAEGETDGKQLVYAGYGEDGQLKGIAVEASGQGYADIIKILYGFDPESEKIIGFYVLESKETPGLGDKIEKDETFLANFEALDAELNTKDDGLKNEIVTVKDGDKENPWEINGITGATISSRAIGEIINKSVSTIGPNLVKNMETFKDQMNNEQDRQQ